jgi:hypothetical protein
MQRFIARCSFFLLTAGIFSMPAHAAGMVDAIEFYNATLDHYFVTAGADEITKLDAGVLVGWKRTGLSFEVLDPTTATPFASPVCRFYGLPSAGLDSHFYSASVAECDDVKRKFAGSWELESDNVFLVYLPDAVTGACPANTTPIYRSWNGRADSNHRYTTDAAVQQSMIARGYVAEGYGPPSMPVAMCSPGSGGGGVNAPPACNLDASNTSPVIGNAIVLTTSCSGNPQRYSWSGCSSTGATCTVTSSAPGSLTYSVIATNAFGDSAPASVTVGWQAPPPQPQCRLVTTVSSEPPVAGTLAMIAAVCSNAPTTFAWTGCTSSSDTCYDRAPGAGAKTYSMSASNAGGSSAPVGVTLGWQASAPAPLGLCGTFPSTLISDTGSGDVTRVNTAAYPDPPGFAWNGVWTVRFTVPANATSTQIGHLTVAEYVGPPTPREATLSRVACDFRSTDPSGSNGPLERAFGTSASAYFALGASQSGYPGLQPGQTYYFNVRNWQPDTATVSCPSTGQARCDAFVDVVMPP